VPNLAMSIGTFIFWAAKIEFIIGIYFISSSSLGDTIKILDFIDVMLVVEWDDELELALLTAAYFVVELIADAVVVEIDWSTVNILLV